MMQPLYLYVLIGSFSIPFLFTFFCIDFIKKWKNFCISTLCIASFFLIWDAIFTNFEIWGFTHSYCAGWYFLKMPIEEWLFFLVIPFCSLFTHFAFFYAFPKLVLNKKATILITGILVCAAVLLLIFNYDKWYTLVNYVCFILVLIFGLFRLQLLQQFYISFLIILIPFFLVNGILTGMLTEIPVVWYDNTENLGRRIVTIPVEDIGYAFSMLFGNLLIFDLLNRREENRISKTT
ncbi:lycopene cyclase domain-containing protein [Flavicella sediminum]|uniref:lycopene cyclase domain-containing protein n=1 Tax=Flavicella sediminum TaxID=2585141 RepID=UPI00111E7584|nr:lycopene cyclase domain-containing protein [Flavicella sediminum]